MCALDALGPHQHILRQEKKRIELTRYHVIKAIDPGRKKSREKHCVLTKTKWPQNDVEIEDMSKVPYAAVVGILMYAMLCTRLEL